MGKKEQEHLNRILITHLNTMHETFQLLEDAPPSSLEKVDWQDVVTLGGEVSKQATIAGMLWSGAPTMKELEENMRVYFNLLQGFILLAHSSKIGAGPTLSSYINASAKHVADTSYSFFKESVSSFGTNSKDQRLSIPQLAGSVWEACGSLKKTPSTNYTAIGRAITQVAVSMKDVLRELKELKPASVEDPTIDNTPDETNDPNESDDEDGDLGEDLSPEEMKIAESAIIVVSDTLTAIKELIRFITGLLRQSEPSDNDSKLVYSLEGLLRLCKEIGIQIDELGACLYPPQEIPALKLGSDKILDNVREIQAEIRKFEGCSYDGLFKACECLATSLTKMKTELDLSETRTKMQNLAVSS
ncbi:uncharacterized protein LOC113282173 [Papaver somniferum]|uniref:uncharacterized protein LOC113282173 n=1 Tax=Papaver somniferum TaxID=3469 RepID=UPI000E6F9C50|nr:uncharacterized protein LOC113282173 [Papaver somniferum]